MDFNLDQLGPEQLPILRSKLQRPRLPPNVIQRQRLIAQLQQLPRPKLTLLSAPAGYGKTTLLRNWATSQEEALAWLTLDAEDNHTSRFARYLQAAWLDRQGRAPANRPPLDNQIARIPLDQLLPHLLHELEAEPGPVTFVFDDMHLLDSKAVLQALSFLIENLPEQARIIIASRSDPDLALARLRAYGQLEELRSLDLRFDRQEIEAFVKAQLGQMLPPNEMDELARKTEGWPAGLQLVVHLLKGNHQLSRIIDGFRGDHPFVFEYLTGEVLQGLDSTLRKFLLQSSILPYLEASLCDEVLDRNDSTKLLARIRAENLFLEPTDPAQATFRYHPLFRDYLQERLTSSLEAIERRQLHQRACQALQDRGRAQLAIPHAVQALDYKTAIRLISDHAQQAMYVGDSASIQRWLSWLPKEHLYAESQLAIWHSWSLAVSGQLDEIDHWLQRIDGGLEAEAAGSVTNQEAHYHAMTIKATVSRFRGETARAIDEAEQALNIMPEDRPVLEAVALLNQGHAYLLCGRISAAIPPLERATELAISQGHRYVALSAQYHLGKCYLARANLDRAELIFSQADQPLGDEVEHALRCVYHLGMGLLEIERDNLDEAASSLEHALRLSQIIGDFIFMREAMEAQVRLYLLIGDKEAAHYALQNLQELGQHLGPINPSMSIDGLQVRLDQLEGFDSSAWDWACKLLAGQFQTPDTSQRGLIKDALAIYFSSDQRSSSSAFEDQIIGLLTEMATQALQDGRLLDWVQFRLLDLSARIDELTEKELLTQLRQLTEHGQLTGLRSHLAGAPRFWHLWKHLQTSSGRHGQFEEEVKSRLERLIDAYQAWHSDQELAAQPFSAADRDLPENLSAREAEVLQLLAQGKSSRQVADSLVITYNTVRTHIRNIYRKLDVHSRLEAIHRAQELQVV